MLRGRYHFLCLFRANWLGRVAASGRDLGLFSAGDWFISHSTVVVHVSSKKHNVESVKAMVRKFLKCCV